MMILSCAKASATEEPDAAIPHVRDCAGGAGYPAFLLRDGSVSPLSRLLPLPPGEG